MILSNLTKDESKVLQTGTHLKWSALKNDSVVAVMSQHLVYTTESTADKQSTKAPLEADALEKSILGLSNGENYLFQLVVKT